MVNETLKQKRRRAWGSLRLGKNNKKASVTKKIVDKVTKKKETE